MEHGNGEGKRMTLEQAIEVLICRYNSGVIRSRTNDDEWRLATETAIAALREKAERERGCAYCVISKRSPDAEYCSNCGRKLTLSLPELANESEEVNQDSHHVWTMIQLIGANL
jgi:hypothetical protein